MEQAYNKKSNKL